MKAFLAKVLFDAGEGKDWGDGLKFQICVTPVDERIVPHYKKLYDANRDKQYDKDYLRINKPEYKAAEIRALQRGQEVLVVEAGTYEKVPYFDIVTLPKGYELREIQAQPF